MKRLLYLKASIDNEQTLNALTVPFEQEKARDHAAPDQLMLDTNAELSGRGSIGAVTKILRTAASKDLKMTAFGLPECAYRYAGGKFRR